MNKGGRAARSSAARTLGSSDPRLRRNAQSGTTDADLGLGLTLDRLGRIAIVLDARSPFFVTEDGALALRTGDGVEAEPGSPVTLRLVAADRSVEITKDGLRARPTASQVKTADGTTVEAALDAAGADVTSLTATVATNTADIATLGAVKADDADVTALQAEIDALEALIALRPVDICLFSRGDAAATLTNLTAADSLLPVAGVTIMVVAADLTGFTEARLIVHRNSGVAAAGTTIHARYHTALSATVGDYVTLGTSAISVLIDDTVARPFIVKSAWVALAAGAKADVFIAPVGAGGDGALDPTIGSIHLQVR